VKTISQTLGVARSNVIERRDNGRTRRGPQERPGDAEVAASSAALSTSDQRMGTGGSPRY
jgi:hypothetical protein